MLTTFLFFLFVLIFLPSLQHGDVKLLEFTSDKNVQDTIFFRFPSLIFFGSNPLHDSALFEKNENAATMTFL